MSRWIVRVYHKNDEEPLLKQEIYTNTAEEAEKQAITDTVEELGGDPDEYSATADVD